MPFRRCRRLPGPVLTSTKSRAGSRAPAVMDIVGIYRVEIAALRCAFTCRWLTKLAGGQVPCKKATPSSFKKRTASNGVGGRRVPPKFLQKDAIGKGTKQAWRAGAGWPSQKIVVPAQSGRLEASCRLRLLLLLHCGLAWSRSLCLGFGCPLGCEQLVPLPHIAPHQLHCPGLQKRKGSVRRRLQGGRTAARQQMPGSKGRGKCGAAKAGVAEAAAEGQRNATKEVVRQQRGRGVFAGHLRWQAHSLCVRCQAHSCV